MSALHFIAQHFQKVQVAILVTVALVVFITITQKNSESRFKTREADRNDLDRLRKAQSNLAEAKLTVKKPSPPPAPPLGLPGIRLSGEPHEILGVSEDASEAEVLKAYKESIKRFHPDRIQGQAQEQMQFYQDASAKLNHAKDEMIKRLRSGRS